MATNALRREDIEKAEVIQKRLSFDYLPYFQNLAMFFTPNTAEGRLIHPTIIKIKRATKLVGRIFKGAGLTSGTLRELQQLNSLVRDIEKAKKDVEEKAIESAFLKTALDEVSELTGISSKDLSLSVKLAKSAKEDKEKKKTTKKEEPSSNLGSGILKLLGLPSIKKTAGLAAIGGLLGPIIGPFIGPAVVGYELARGLGALGGLGITGAKKVVGGAKRLFGSNKLNEIQNKISSTGVGIPSFSRSVGAGVGTPSFSRSVGAGVGIPSFSRSVGAGVGIPSFSRSVGAGVGTPFRTLSRRKKEAATEPMFYFFDKRAYTARWTRDLMAAVTGKKIKGRGGGGVGTGIVGGIVGAGVAGITTLALGTGVAITIAGTAILAGLGIKNLFDKWRNFVKDPTDPKNLKPSWFEKISPLGFLSFVARLQIAKVKAVEGKGSISLAPTAIVPLGGTGRTILGDIKKANIVITEMENKKRFGDLDQTDPFKGIDFSNSREKMESIRILNQIRENTDPKNMPRGGSGEGQTPVQRPNLISDNEDPWMSYFPEYIEQLTR